MSYPPNRNKWRVGLASNALRYLRQLGIRLPDAWTFLHFSERQDQSTGGEAVHGHQNLTLSWRDLSLREAHILYNNYIIPAQAASPPLLYLTINRANAAAPGGDWIDISGRPHYPEYQPGVRGNNMVNVTLFINDITVINTPASF